MQRLYFYFSNRLLKKILFFLAFNFILLHTISCIYYFATLEEIKSGSLVYSNELGWINKKHAISDGPKQFLERYDKKELKINDTLVYAQFMGSYIISEKLYFKVQKKYIVTRDLPQIDKEKILFCIFKDVTERFEDIQGKIPFYFFKPNYSSGFADGDLTGNLISYYCAFNHMNEYNLINGLSLHTFNDSLKSSLRINYNIKKEWVLPKCKNNISDFYYKHSSFDWQQSVKEIEETIKFQKNSKY